MPLDGIPRLILKLPFAFNTKVFNERKEHVLNYSENYLSFSGVLGHFAPTSAGSYISLKDPQILQILVAHTPACPTECHQVSGNRNPSYQVGFDVHYIRRRHCCATIYGAMLPFLSANVQNP